MSVMSHAARILSLRSTGSARHPFQRFCSWRVFRRARRARFELSETAGWLWRYPCSPFGVIVEMASEPRAYVPHDTLLLVGDGQKALFLRNKGSAQCVRLVVEQIL